MASTSYPSSLAQAENSLSRKQGIDFSDHLNTLFFQFIWWRITASQHIAPAKSINLRLPELVPPQFIESGRKNLMNPMRPGGLGLIGFMRFFRPLSMNCGGTSSGNRRLMLFAGAMC